MVPGVNWITWNWITVSNFVTMIQLPTLLDLASRILAFRLPPNVVIRQLNQCYNRSCATCLVLCFPALVLLRKFTHGGIGQIVLLCALLVTIGFGVNFIAIPLLAKISYAIEANEKSRPELYGAKGAYAQGYALLNTGYATGGLVGPLWSGYVVNRAGWETLGWSLGLMCALTTIPIIIWTGGESTNKSSLGTSTEASSQRYSS